MALNLQGLVCSNKQRVNELEVGWKEEEDLLSKKGHFSLQE